MPISPTGRCACSTPARRSARWSAPPRPPDRHGRPRHALAPMERRSRADSRRVRRLPGRQTLACAFVVAVIRLPPQSTRRATPSAGRLRHAAELPLRARWRAQDAAERPSCRTHRADSAAAAPHLIRPNGPKGRELGRPPASRHGKSWIRTKSCRTACRQPLGAPASARPLLAVRCGCLVDRGSRPKNDRGRMPVPARNQVVPWRRSIAGDVSPGAAAWSGCESVSLDCSLQSIPKVWYRASRRSFTGHSVVLRGDASRSLDTPRDRVLRPSGPRVLEE